MAAIQDSKKAKNGEDEKIPYKNKKKYMAVLNCAGGGSDYLLDNLISFVPNIIGDGVGIATKVLGGQSWQKVLGDVAVNGVIGTVNQISTGFTSNNHTKNIAKQTKDSEKVITPIGQANQNQNQKQKKIKI